MAPQYPGSILNTVGFSMLSRVLALLFAAFVGTVIGRPFRQRRAKSTVFGVQTAIDCAHARCGKGEFFAVPEGDPGRYRSLLASTPTVLHCVCVFVSAQGKERVVSEPPLSRFDLNAVDRHGLPSGIAGIRHTPTHFTILVVIRQYHIRVSTLLRSGKLLSRFTVEDATCLQQGVWLQP